MTQLIYEHRELMRSHDYAFPHVEAGHRLHGGLDSERRYVSPRMLVREPAIAAWTQALRARDGDLLPADSSLLAGIRYPNRAQHKLLLQEGLGQSFWNMLTIVGKIEARGRVLATLEFPELGDFIVEDVSGMGIGHLNKGLLVAHGIDEGGEPEKGIGGHDVMWFAVRDLAFGTVDTPDPPVPETIGRPETDAPELPGVNAAAARVVDFLLNLLLIELRAERTFSLTEDLLRDPELFIERRSEANRGAEMVGRIRQDEAVHVSSLRLFLGEICSVSFRTGEATPVPGRELIDLLWGDIVHWATVEQPRLQAEEQRKLYRDRILAHREGERILADFNALDEG